MTFPFGTVVNGITRTKTGVDSLGTDVYSSTTTALPVAAFDPGGTTEVTAQGDLVTQSPRVIWVDTLPDLTAIDAVQLADGTVWEIEGNPLTEDDEKRKLRLIVETAHEVWG